MKTSMFQYESESVLVLIEDAVAFKYKNIKKGHESSKE